MRKVRTKGDYDVILNAFREHGQNYTKVAEVTGRALPTVRRAWEVGWPDVPDAGPIRDRFKLEKVLTRAARTEEALKEGLDAARAVAKGIDAPADVLVRSIEKAKTIEQQAEDTLREAQRKLAEVEELARGKLADADKAAHATLQRAEMDAKDRLAELLKKAKVDAAETLADEANAAKFGRKAALGATALAALVLRDANTLAASLRVTPEEMAKLTPMVKMRVAREMVRLVEAAEKALILALQAERLRVGQPTEVLGVQSMDESFEEKEIKLRAVQKSLERARARNLRLVEGGGDAQQPEDVVDASAAEPAPQQGQA